MRDETTKFAFFAINTNPEEVEVDELATAVTEAAKDPAHVPYLIQILGKFMTSTTNQQVTDRQIQDVAKRLDNNTPSQLGTGEGKSTAEMLLYATQALLGKEQAPLLQLSALVKRNLQDYHSFFLALGLKTKIETLNEKYSFLAVSVDSLQEAGQIARKEGP